MINAPVIGDNHGTESPMLEPICIPNSVMIASVILMIAADAVACFQNSACEIFTNRIAEQSLVSERKTIQANLAG